MHCLFKQETVLRSLKDDCHPGLAHFRIDQFPIGNDNEGEKNVIETLDPFSVDAVQSIQVPFRKPITRNAKTLIQQFFSGADNEIRLGVENHKTICPTELIWFYLKKLITKKEPPLH